MQKKSEYNSISLDCCQDNENVIQSSPFFHNSQNFIDLHNYEMLQLLGHQCCSCSNQINSSNSIQICNCSRFTHKNCFQILMEKQFMLGKQHDPVVCQACNSLISISYAYKYAYDIRRLKTPHKIIPLSFALITLVFFIVMAVKGYYHRYATEHIVYALLFLAVGSLIVAILKAMKRKVLKIESINIKQLLKDGYTGRSDHISQPQLITQTNNEQLDLNSSIQTALLK